jgi:hypothetical protein
MISNRCTYKGRDPSAIFFNPSLPARQVPPCRHRRVLGSEGKKAASRRQTARKYKIAEAAPANLSRSCGFPRIPAPFRVFHLLLRPLTESRKAAKNAKSPEPNSCQFVSIRGFFQPAR